jgi:hypothetical protein
MSTTSSYTPGKMTRQLKDLITGLTQNPPPNVTSLLVDGKTYTLQELLTALSAYAALYNAVDRAHATFRAAFETRSEIEPDASHLVQGVRAVLKGMFGKKSVALESYGIRPEKEPASLTAEQEVVKVAKAKATRKARHTMGPRQRAKIKGQTPSTPTTPGPFPSEG